MALGFGWYIYIYNIDIVSVYIIYNLCYLFYLNMTC